LPRLHLAHLLYTIFGIFHFAAVLNFFIPSFLKEIILCGWAPFNNERTPRGALLYCVKLGFVSMSMGLPLCPHDRIEEALELMMVQVVK